MRWFKSGLDAAVAVDSGDPLVIIRVPHPDQAGQVSRKPESVVNKRGQAVLVVPKQAVGQDGRWPGGGPACSRQPWPSPR